MDTKRFTVLGPLMGGKGSRAFLGTVQDDEAVGSRRGQQRPVVMVFLPDGIVDNAELLKHVEEETKVASEIDHINVIGVWGLAPLPEGTARVVEFADGESLSTIYERLKELGRPLPPNLAAAFVKDACMGAHYAHELGRMETGVAMIHGGIRPQTLLVSFQGMAKVTGYGAAVLAEWLRKERGEEAIVRDPYTAPESIFGGRTAATEQSDVYSLGAVLFEALTGHSHVNANAGIGDAMLREDVTPEQLVGVHPALADIVIRAMKRNATERFSNALDMRMALLDTDLCASDQEVRSFMEEVFPPDYPSRVARTNLLASARRKREVTRPRQRVPPSAEAEQHRHAANTAAIEAAERGPRPIDREPQTPPEMSVSEVSPAANERTDPYQYGPEVTAKPPIQKIAQEDKSSGPVHAPAPAPASVPAPAPPQVVYKTPAWIPVAFALVVGAAVALGAVLFLQDRPSAVLAGQQKQPDPQPPAAPVPSQPPSTTSTKTQTAKSQATAPQSPKAKPKPKRKPTKGKLVVTAVPAVAIYIDGKKAGIGKASVEVKPGKHRVKLKDRKKGINSTQKVRIKAGETKRVSFEIGKGKLLLSAPHGSLVYLDGRKIGEAPLDPYTVYEGRHILTVKREVGGPQFKRKFRVRPGDEVSMWVEFRAQ